MQTIGKELKNCRVYLRMTLPKMAARLNVSATTIVNYETCKRMPDIDFLIDFAEISGKNLGHGNNSAGSPCDFRAGFCVWPNLFS